MAGMNPRYAAAERPRVRRPQLALLNRTVVCDVLRDFLCSFCQVAARLPTRDPTGVRLYSVSC
jgi:hypothetical protein